MVTYSLDFTITKLGSMRLVSFISCGGRKRRFDDTDATVVISDATNMKIAARKAALQNLRSEINNKNEARKCFRSSFQRDC